MTNLSLETVNCSACDGHHYDTSCHEYKTPKPPATHWYICPTTNDPVDIAVVAIDKNKNIVLAAEVVAMLARALASDAWLVCVWNLHDGGKSIHFSRKAHQFPLSEFPVALNQLRDDLRANEHVDVDGPQPMQRAQRPAPTIDLFGGQAEKADAEQDQKDQDA